MYSPTLNRVGGVHARTLNYLKITWSIHVSHIIITSGSCFSIIWLMYIILIWFRDIQFHPISFNTFWLTLVINYVELFEKVSSILCEEEFSVPILFGLGFKSISPPIILIVFWQRIYRKSLIDWLCMVFYFHNILFEIFL